MRFFSELFEKTQKTITVMNMIKFDDNQEIYDETLKLGNCVFIATQKVG